MNHQRPRCAPRDEGRLRRRLECERLEDRTVPAVLPGFSHVNSTFAGNQHHAVSASNYPGARVVVWVHDVNSTVSELHGQIYNAAAQKVGPNIVLVRNLRASADPAVCMDSSGKFSVSYTRQITGSNTDVWVTRFTAAGVAVRTTAVTTQPGRQYDSSIACDLAGNFVVSYTTEKIVANGHVDRDVLAVRFLPNGLKFDPLLGVRDFNVAVGPGDDALSDVAVSNTFFSFAYVSNRQDVVSRRFTLSGTPFRLPVSVGSPTRIETNPSVALDANDVSVIAFQQFDGNDWNIVARKVLKSGDMSPIWTIQGGSTDDMTPSIAMTRLGRFVVTYTSVHGTFIRVVAAEVRANGAIDRNSYVFTSTNLLSALPCVSIDGSGRFLIVATARKYDGEADNGIFARFGVP